jgi:hypothetical protein
MEDDDREDVGMVGGGDGGHRGAAACRHNALLRIGYLLLFGAAVNTLLLCAIFGVALTVRQRVDTAVDAAAWMVRPADGAAGARPSKAAVAYASSLLRQSVQPVLFGAADDSVATQLEELMTYDIRGFFSQASNTMSDVDRVFRQKACTADEGGGQYECQLTNAIAGVASLAASVSSQIAGKWVNVKAGGAVADAMKCEMEGRGLLSFDLVRVMDWGRGQMSEAQWKSLGVVCDKFTTQVEDVRWKGAYSDAAGRRQHWDVTGGVEGVAHMMHTMCGRLSRLKVEPAKAVAVHGAAKAEN